MCESFDLTPDQQDVARREVAATFQEELDAVDAEA
jgi:hypothetical protein